ncbi:hypothetical protein J4E83_005448 [Alternaria metachromatica]|uniref:uncharacterized protein n=1 Tax=Alternaria metachromatica TaxID=283354 RepID=UPI0020C4953F|nr:uncharacterized protein J4E83_005448 [Alternaria metachromatica]KAI4621085.1 hypothetical protein J4E83_005448 [Alternaria metachromatica]
MAFSRLQKLVDNAAAQLDEELLAGLPFTVRTPSPRRLLKLMVDHATDLNFSFELHETILQLEKNRALHAQVEHLTLELELERGAKLRFKEAAEGHVELSVSRRAALSSACAQERMRGELQAKLDLSIEAAAISQAAQEVAAGHRRAYFWQGFLRGDKWDNKLQPLRRLVGEPSSAASATTSRPPAPLSDKLTRAEAFHEARAAQLWELVRKTDGKAANLPGRFKDNNKAGMAYRLAAPAELKAEHPSKVYFDRSWSHAVSFSPT